jgi:hypothetical protein
VVNGWQPATESGLEGTKSWRIEQVVYGKERTLVMAKFKAPKVERQPCAPLAPASFPPLTEQAKNFAGFAGRTALRLGANAIKSVQGKRPDPVLVPAGVKAARLAVCEACPNLEGGRCKLCGCRMDIWVKKVAWATEQCRDTPPRWGAWNGPLTGS